MIRNIFIVQYGVPLVQMNFGECHSLGVDSNLVASFIGALNSFSTQLTGQSIKSINLGDHMFHFYNSNNLLHVLVTDQKDDVKTIDFKIDKISTIFFEKYSDSINNFTGDVSLFEDFKDILIGMNLAQKNCGGRPECEGCTNSSKTLRALDEFGKNRKGFFKRFTLKRKQSNK